MTKIEIMRIQEQLKREAAEARRIERDAWRALMKDADEESARYNNKAQK